LPKSYSVLHVRVGDNYINSEIPTVKLNFYTELVKKHITTGDILCSDNAFLKRHIASVIPGIIVFVNDTHSGHVGRDNDKLTLKNTLDDLQIIIGAKTVYTYSEYTWVSGFVHWVTTCFDIPMIDVK
jgi:hypothetical protein